MSQPPTLIDLFAGCGGMTAGFMAAGFSPVAAVEHDLYAAATYAANFGDDHIHWTDIASWDSRAVPEVDVVIGGPPCQGFSNLGSRDPADPRNQLWREYVRVVLAANPKIFVIENVDRFRTSHEFSLLETEIQDGALSHYEMTVAVLNAADYGVPQRRRRTIVVASRVGTPSLPAATHAKNGQQGLPSWSTVRDVIADVPPWPESTELPNTKTPFFGVDVPGPFKEPEIHLGRNPRPLSKRRYECIPPGGGRFDLPDELLPNCWRNKPTGTTDVMGRMRWDAPSLTIRTEFFKPEKGAYLHPQWVAGDPAASINRPITHREAARLQTFPEEFLWCGPKIQIAKQIGNAVPPRFAESIGSAVAAQLGVATP